MNRQILSPHDFKDQLLSVFNGKSQLFDRDRSLADDAFYLIASDGRFGTQKLAVMVSQIDNLIDSLQSIKNQYQRESDYENVPSVSGEE